MSKKVKPSWVTQQLTDLFSRLHDQDVENESRGFKVKPPYQMPGEEERFAEGARAAEPKEKPKP